DLGGENELTRVDAILQCARHRPPPCRYIPPPVSAYRTAAYCILNRFRGPKPGPAPIFASPRTAPSRHRARTHGSARPRLRDPAARIRLARHRSRRYRPARNAGTGHGGAETTRLDASVGGRDSRAAEPRGRRFHRAASAADPRSDTTWSFRCERNRRHSLRRSGGKPLRFASRFEALLNVS